MLQGKYNFFLVGEIIFAISQSLFSGSYDAYLYKVVSENKLDYNKILSSTVSAEWLSIALASVLSTYVAQISLLYVFYATLIINIISFIWVLTLPKIIYTPNESGIGIVIEKFFKEVFTNTKLLYWMGHSVIFNVAVVSGFFVIQIYLNERGYASDKNGFLYFFITVFAFFSSKAYPSAIKSKLCSSKTNTLIIMLFLLAGTFAMLSFSNNIFVSFSLLCLFRFIWGFAAPFFTAILNDCIKSDESRSSLLSFNSLLSNFVRFILLLVTSSLSVNFVFLLLASITFILMILIFSKVVFDNRKPSP